MKRLNVQPFFLHLLVPLVFTNLFYNHFVIEYCKKSVVIFDSRIIANPSYQEWPSPISLLVINGNYRFGFHHTVLNFER